MDVQQVINSKAMVQSTCSNKSNLTGGFWKVLADTITAQLPNRIPLYSNLRNNIRAPNSQSAELLFIRIRSTYCNCSLSGLLHTFVNS